MKNNPLPAATLLAFGALAAVPHRAQSVVQTVPAGAAPQGIVVNPVTGTLYVTIGTANVLKINGVTGATTSIPVGGAAYSMALNPATNRIYVTLNTGNTLAVIDGATDGVTPVTVGNGPRGPGINPLTNRIYVPNNGDNTVSVVDGATNTVITTISAGVGAVPFAAGVNVLNNKIYVTHNSPNPSTPGIVTVINGVTNAVVKTLGMEYYPQHLAVNPVTNRIYVANNNSGHGAGSVTVIDGATDTIMTTLPAGAYATGITLNPVTNKLYVPAENSNNVTVVDGATNTTSTVGTGSFPVTAAVNPVTNTIAVTNYGSNSVTLINGATLATSTVNVGNGPTYSAFNPVTGRLYVGNDTGNSVSVVDMASYGVAGTALGVSPNAITVNPVTNKVYAVSNAGNVVKVVDGATGATSTIPVGAYPLGLDVNPITGKIYVSNYQSGSLSVIDGATATVDTTITVGANPTYVGLNTVTNRVYVINVADSSVTPVDGYTNIAGTAIPVGNSPYKLDINPVTNRIYVANGGSNSVTVIDGVTNLVIATVPVNGEPRDVKVNPVTNKIYAPSWTGNVVTIIDGVTHATITAPAGSGARDIAINPLTNKIYVAAYYSNNVTVVDGATNATTIVSAGTWPGEMRINLATNKIYVGNAGSSNVTIIDGATNSPVLLATPGPIYDSFAVNPMTGRIYVQNYAGNTVNAITEQPVQTLPLTTAITPLPGNQTGNPAPTFTFTAATAYSPGAPPPQNVFFQLDGWQGTWLKAAKSGPNWTGTTPAMLPGLHILYAWAADGQESASDNPNEISNPIIGQITAYLFQVITLSITTPSLPDGSVNVAYSRALAAAGGSGAGYVFSPVPGFPAWLALSSGGLLSGTPGAGDAGPVAITVRVTDSQSNTVTRAYTFNIRPPFAITTSSLPSGEVNTPYAPTTLTATGGSGGNSWTPVSGFPAWLTLSSSGLLSGTPTVSGSVNLSVRVTDSALSSDTRTFSFNIYAALSITTASLPSGTVGAPYSRTLAASGGSGGNNWTITSGLTPSGLSFSVGGTLSGTPLAAGSYPFTVRVQDSLGVSATRPYSLTVIQLLAIINSNLTQGVIGQLYPYTALQAAGGFPQYLFTLTAGTLPNGIVMNNSGQFTGRPTQLGNFPVTFTVTDSTNATASRAFVMSVVNPAGRPTWTPRGQFGGRIQSVRVSPNYGADATLLVMSETGELFRSSDKGTTWSRALVNPSRAYNYENRFLLSPAFNAVAAPGTAEQKAVFFASYDIGVWKSPDYGASFAAINAGLPCPGPGCGAGGGPHIIGLAIHPNYAGTGGTHILWAADFDNNVYRYVDSGGSPAWTLLASLPEPPGALETVISPSPAIAGDHTLFLSIANKIYRSLDDGATWALRYSALNSMGQPLIVQALVFSPNYATDHSLIAETDGFRLFRTQDGGANFADISTPGSAYGQHLSVVARPAGAPALWFMESPNASAFVYRLLYSEDTGTTFTPLYANGMSSGNDFSYALAPSPWLGAGADLYYGTEQGLYASTDGGFSFDEHDQGLSANVVYSVAGTGSVVAAAYKGGWFKSADKAASRVRLTAPEAASGFKEVYFNAVSPDYPNDHVIFLGDASALLRSGDGGQTFNEVLSGPASDTHHAFAPGFTGLTGTMYVGNAAGLYKSTDGGRNFTALPLPSPLCSSTANPAIQGIAVSPNFAADQTLFIASATPGDGAGGLCRSSDGGGSWTQVKNGAALISGPVALSPIYNHSIPGSGPAKTLMVYQLRSTDGGATWSTAGGPASLNGISIFSPHYGIAPSSVDDNTVFMYGDGIFRSTDGGASFAALGVADALKSRTVTGLYLPPDFNRVSNPASQAVAATNGSGVWRSADAGQTFTPAIRSASLDAVVNSIVRVPGGGVTSLQQGSTTPAAPAASAGTIPAGSLLAATQNQGVFESDDGGVTFSNISAGLPPNANATAVTAPTISTATPVAAVVSQGLWRYNGVNWLSIPGLGAGSYTSFTEDGAWLYATRVDGVSVRTGDGGASWQPLDAAQTRLIAMSWNNSTGPTTLGDPAAAFFGPPALDAAAAVSAALWSVSQNGGPLYSIDSGANWIAAPGLGDYLLPAGLSYRTIQALGLNPSSGGRELLTGATAGLFRSTDGGAEWRLVSGPGSGLETTSLNFSTALASPTAYGTTDTLVGAVGSTNGGVYLSGDGGEHWTQVNEGFDPANLSISTLVKTSCAGCPVQYYSGTYGSGVYTRTITVNPPPSFAQADGGGWCFGSTTCTCGIAPSSGPEQGGQPFKLCGKNFLALAAVEFDGVPAAGCSVDTGTVPQSVACSGTPPHVPGTAVIRLRNTDTRVGLVSTLYTYNPGVSRASNLRLAKSGNNAVLTWNCPDATCTVAAPARVARGQNALITLNPELYNGGASSGGSGGWTNTGALASGSNGSYFWRVE
jgi:YVTN family beta-propeller protein